jgi:hypothetical protein
VKADNTTHLHRATRRRSEQARQRAVTTLDRLLTDGTPVTVSSLAREAEVARSWIYTQPDLLDRIHGSGDRRPSPGSPQRQGASEASWQRRLELAHTRITELIEENKQLRHQLALAHGQRRADRIASSRTPSATHSTTTETEATA